MKIFLTILLSITFILCCNPSSGGVKEDREAQQKLLQLKQLLIQTTEQRNNLGIAQPQNNSSTNTPDLLPLSDSPPQNNTQTITTAPSFVTTTPVSSNQVNQSSAGLYDQAFSGVVNQLLPMSPNQIAKLHDVFTQTQKVAATSPGVPPKPISASLLVDLSPQASPPIIRLGAGYITSLVFIDSTGQPWPIAAYSIGDPSAFNVQWDQKGNTLLVQSMTFYKRSNLAVMLRDLNTPVMVTLISGQEAIDYRVDLRVPGIGPNAIYVQNGIPDAANPILFDVLNGIPPKGSKELRVSGGDCQAWLLDSKLYLRTNLNITSPGWQSIISSVDGTHAYQLQPSPVLLALKNGKDKIITLTLEGLE